MAFKFSDRYNTESYNGTLIVDALNLAFRWKHGPKYGDFKYDMERTITSIAHSYKCSNIIICADQKHSSYRRAIYPAYKADRKERFKEQTPEELEKFQTFFSEYEAALILLKEQYEVFRYPNVEADDIAAHLVLHKKQYELENIWLLSSDDDWSLLIQEGVNRFSWRTRKEITIDNWYDHYEVSPEQFISYKVLMGDKSDNIPGIPLVGPKRAAGLLKQYDSAFDILDAVPLDGKYKYEQNINEYSHRIERNYELMDLITYADTAIGEEYLSDIRSRFGDIKW